MEPSREHLWMGPWQAAWPPQIVLEVLRDCLAQRRERTSKVGPRLLRGKVASSGLPITCLSPRRALETFWMAEVAFLVRGWALWP